MFYEGELHNEKTRKIEWEMRQTDRQTAWKREGWGLVVVEGGSRNEEHECTD